MFFPDTAIIKCPNCNLQSKKSELVSTATANIMIKDEKGENMGRFFCPHAVVSELFQTITIASAPGFNIDKNIDTLSANIMEETLLNVSFLCFQVIMDNKIVKSIDLGGTYRHSTNDTELWNIKGYSSRVMALCTYYDYCFVDDSKVTFSCRHNG